MSKSNVVFDIESLAQQKSMDQSIVYQVVEQAMAAVIGRKYPEEVVIRVDIDPELGTQRAFRVWDVVDEDAPELSDPKTKACCLELVDARQIDPEAAIGVKVEQEIEVAPFGRIDAQQAKQLIVRLIREAEREKVATSYQHRIGEIITGVVKKATRESIILDLSDNLEAVIARGDMIPRESVRNGDRVRGYLYALSTEPRGPLLQLSRSCPEMLVELFKIEVPEISEGSIEMRAVARDPGSRAKIAVTTQDMRIDPIGACVGMRGSRVQAVSNELNGERIDIVLWDDDPTQMVINAMAPADVISISVDEQNRVMNVAVSEERLSQAIGRSGQNVRLASELVGWTLNVMGEDEAAERDKSSSSDLIERLTTQLEIDEEVSEILIREGFANVREIAHASVGEMVQIDEFDQEVAQELIARAKSTLLSQVISGEDTEYVKEKKDLMQLTGMDEDLAVKLVEMGILSREALADLSVDDLENIEGLDSARAGALIMEARAPWFEQDEG